MKQIQGRNLKFENECSLWCFEVTNVPMGSRKWYLDNSSLSAMALVSRRWRPHSNQNTQKTFLVMLYDLGTFISFLKIDIVWFDEC